MCGDFYIGGRQFDSLSDLIGYYTHCSDLLKRERLVHPVPPPEPVNDKKRMVAILPYTKMPDTDELRFVVITIVHFMKIIFFLVVLLIKYKLMVFGLKNIMSLLFIIMEFYSSFQYTCL